MRVLIYGAGVLGSYLAHVLHRGDNDVTLLARGKRLEELRENGLVIKCYLMLKLMVATPIGRLACSDHAMTAKGEMKRLYADFCSLKNSAGINTPAWNELEHYMI